MESSRSELVMVPPLQVATGVASDAVAAPSVDADCAGVVEPQAATVRARIASFMAFLDG
jgi:hypothetical protein